MITVIITGLEETFEGDGYVNGIDYGNGFTDVHLSPNAGSCIH